MLATTTRTSSLFCSTDVLVSADKCHQVHQQGMLNQWEKGGSVSEINFLTHQPRGVVDEKIHQPSIFFISQNKHFSDLAE